MHSTERFRYELSENGIIYHALTYCFGDIRVWSQRIFLNCCWLSIFFDTLIANISWTVAHTPISDIVFWKSGMRAFRCIYVKCFNRLKFLAEVSTKLQKVRFFGQFKDHNSGRTHGIPHFLSTSFALTMYHSILYSKINFHVVPLLVHSGL